MDEIVAVLARQHADLANVLAELNDADWSRDTRCEGWTVSDVLLHLAQTDEMARASAEGRYGEWLAEIAEGLPPTTSVDEGAGAMVARQRGPAGAVIRDRWGASAAVLRDALAACDPSLRVDWVTGQVSARTLATTRVAETWIHTGDIAEAVGVTPIADDRLWHISRLAWRTLAYAFAQGGRTLTGPVAFELRAPSGENWEFLPHTPPATTIRGDALELCLVAARRVDPETTRLTGVGPDAAAVLQLVRTYA